MDIVQDTILSFNSYLERIRHAGVTIAALLRQDQIDDALAYIGELAEGLIWMTDVASRISEYNIVVQLEVEEIKDFLREINEGLQMEDYVLVSDLFEYEIDPFINKINKIEYGLDEK